MNNIVRDIRNWVNKHNMQIDSSYLDDLRPAQEYEIYEQLFAVLLPSAKQEGCCETGTYPSEYLSPVVESFLDALDQNDWRVNQITTSDDWDSATVELVNTSGTSHCIFLEDVDDSDWVPPSLFYKIEEFSIIHCKQTLKTFICDDPYIIVPMTPSVAKELETIISIYAVPR